MKRNSVLTTVGMFIGLTLVVINVSHAMAQQGKAENPDWSLNATVIDACSCPMFCQCFFDTKPAAHASSHKGHGGAEHFCRFNNAYRVNKGHFENVKLDGAKFWLAGDLGADFSEGRADWAVIHFDPSVTKEQRDAIRIIVGHVFPFKWNSFTVARDARMEWKATKDRAEARLDGGKTAEVVVRRFPGLDDNQVVIQNIRYLGTPRNDGIVLMPNEVEAYRVGDKAFEFKGTNGLITTIDIASKDVK